MWLLCQWSSECAFYPWVDNFAESKRTKKSKKKKKKKKNFKEIGNRTTLWKTIPRWGLIPLFQNLAHSILMVAHPQFHLVVVYTLDAPHYTS